MEVKRCILHFSIYLLKEHFSIKIWPGKPQKSSNHLGPWQYSPSKNKSEIWFFFSKVKITFFKKEAQYLDHSDWSLLTIQTEGKYLNS